jgi:copper(I)-binding protein
MVATLDDALRFAFCCALASALAGAPLPAAAVAVITVSDPWVRVAPNGKSAEAFMEIRSSEGATIVGVESDVTAAVPLQRPGSQRAVADSIPLPAGTSVKLAPGAYRLLLPRLSRALQLGDRVALNLIVEAPDGTRQVIPVKAEVRRRSAYDDHLRPHSHAR